MACSLTVEALLHPWSGRLDIASRLPIFTHEYATISNTPVKSVRNLSITMRKKRKHKTLSIDLSWILDTRGGNHEYVSRRFPEEEECTSMMESSDESPGSEDEPCECVHDVNESLPPDADTEPEEGTDKHTNLHSEIPSIIEEALVPPLTRKMSPGLMYHNEYFEVAKSSVAGWGAFAVRDLAKGDVILREIPLFVAETDNVFHEFYKLDKDAMDVALSLHSHGLIKGGTPKIIGIWQTNCFAVTHHMAGLFPIAARFNHACYPANNVDYQYDHDNNALTMMAREDIAAGKELTISYGMNLSPLLLYLCYGFRCSCGGCKGLNDEEVAIFTMQW